MNTIKKIVSIFLLVAFLFDLLGYIPLFEIAQHRIKKEIKGRLKRGVPDEDLYVIKVTVAKAQDLDWEEKGKEFRYQGTMYDIVRSEIKDGYIYYHCVNDRQETRLFAHLEELINDQANKDDSPIGKTAKSISKMFCAFKSIATYNLVFIALDSKSTEFFNYSCFFSPVFQEIFSPPPNRLV